uniref:Uncharacterized protein n=1 Tax=Rhizophora mucronata TaxID=61149 RepID=A0A2P2PHQ5_RHIMU
MLLLLLQVIPRYLSAFIGLYVRVCVNLLYVLQEILNLFQKS